MARDRRRTGPDAATVRSVIDFGAFVDLGGMDWPVLHCDRDELLAAVREARANNRQGLAISSMSKSQIRPRNRQDSLSLKQTGPNPWEHAAERYAVGAEVIAANQQVRELRACRKVGKRHRRTCFRSANGAI